MECVTTVFAPKKISHRFHASLTFPVNPLLFVFFVSLSTYRYTSTCAHTYTHRCSSVVPVAVDEGIEGQSIIPATGEVNHVDLRTEIMDIKWPACECGMTSTVETPSPHYCSPFSEGIIGLKTSFHPLMARLSCIEWWPARAQMGFKCISKLGKVPKKLAERSLNFAPLVAIRFPSSISSFMAFFKQAIHFSPFNKEGLLFF